MTNQSGREFLICLKAVAGCDGPQLGLRSEHDLRLRPVATRKEYQSKNDVRCLTEWRNRFVDSFLTEFVATEEQTSKWLSQITGPSDDNILFMVDDANGVTAGYMGIGYIDWENNYAEADAIVKGGELPKGAMMQALKTLIAWGKGQLGIGKFGVRVRSDNPALDFYRKLGFVETSRMPLSKIKKAEMIQWIDSPDDTSSGVTLVHMMLDEMTG